MQMPNLGECPGIIQGEAGEKLGGFPPRRIRDGHPPFGAEAAHGFRRDGAIAALQFEQQACEIGGNLNIHGR